MTTHYPETQTVYRTFSHRIALISVAACLSSLSATAQSPANSAVRIERGTTNHSAHVRCGPGPPYGGLWWIDNGERVTVTERRAGWAKIRFSGGRGGWIDDRNIDPEEERQASGNLA